MTTVYVIQDGVNNYYVGITDHYVQRMTEHKLRKVKATANMVSPRQVVHKWQCPNRIAAAQLESFLHKSMGGHIASESKCSILLELILDCPMYCEQIKQATAHIKIKDFAF